MAEPSYTDNSAAVDITAGGREPATVAADDLAPQPPAPSPAAGPDPTEPAPEPAPAAAEAAGTPEALDLLSRAIAILQQL